jgi:hypothetical protein
MGAGNVIGRMKEIMGVFRLLLLIEMHENVRREVGFDFRRIKEWGLGCPGQNGIMTDRHQP